MPEHTRLSPYYLTAMLSVLIAVTGLTYNTWRQEVSEDNNNIRTASFTILNQLAQLEQLIYVLHYDQDESEGNPRKGWVQLGLVNDLSIFVDPSVEAKAQDLQSSWKAHWHRVLNDEASVTVLVADIEAVRHEIKRVLRELD